MRKMPIRPYYVWRGRRGAWGADRSRHWVPRFISAGVYMVFARNKAHAITIARSEMEVFK